MRCRNTTLPTIALISSAAVILGSGVVADRASEGIAQPENADAMNEMMAMDPAVLLEMMKAASAPDAHHKYLDQFAGEFDCELSFWMDPTAEPEVATATCVTEWELGGRYLVTDFRGHFAFAGMEVPMSGMGIMGYDRNKGEYFSAWMDTMNTGIMMQTGAVDPGTKQLSVEGISHTPMGESKMRNVYRVTDTGFVMEFHEPSPMTGEMMQTGQIVYTRR